MKFWQNQLQKILHRDKLCYKEVVCVRKPTRLGLKLLLFGLFAAVLALWYWLKLPCVIRYFTGIPCPGCGMSRAWLQVFRLDLAQAVHYHPMFWIVPILAVYILYDGKPIRNSKVNSILLILLLSGFFLCYIFRLISFLNGTLTI